jgi:iron complex outermembrane receptor protein
MYQSGTGLKPTSTNFSLGFTLTPTDRLSFTADAYVINLRDRITLTGTLLGPEITQVLQGNGITSTSGGQYFINGADTRTKGLDLVSNYNQDLGQYGSLKWTAAFNWNQTTILNYKESTTILGKAYDLMDRQAVGVRVKPRLKLVERSGLSSWAPKALAAAELTGNTP